MTIWTVDIWQIRSGRESHFLDRCSDLSPGHLILYRDLNDAARFWSPARWEGPETLAEWRGSEAYAAALTSIAEDVGDHQGHVMAAVPGFPPGETE